MGVMNCNIIVDFTECYGSESISQVVFFLLQLFSQSTTLLSELVALVYDDMCHLRKYLDLRQTKNPLYEQILNKWLAVDRLHIRNHKLKVKNSNGLTYCGKYCDPYSDDLKRVLLGLNTMVCEETFRWFSRFKVIS